MYGVQMSIIDTSPIFAPIFVFLGGVGVFCSPTPILDPMFVFVGGGGVLCSPTSSESTDESFVVIYAPKFLRRWIIVIVTQICHTNKVFLNVTT